MLVPPVNPNVVAVSQLASAVQPQKLQQNQATQAITRRPANPVEQKQAVRARDRRHNDAQREERGGHDLNIKV